MEILSTLVGEILCGLILLFLKFFVLIPLIYVGALGKWLFAGKKLPFLKILKEDGNWFWGALMLVSFAGFIVCIC